jgi:hypothetical protein
MTKWDGHERRHMTADGREGRRPADRHCAQHEILWEHHEDDKNKFREITCGKIVKVESSLAKEVERLEKVDEALRKVDEALDFKIEILKNTIVGKYWFRIVVGFLCAGMVGLGVQQNWAFKEIIQNQREFSVLVNSIENKQIEMLNWKTTFEKEHETLKQRQDILRDRDLKHMDEFHKK